MFLISFHFDTSSLIQWLLLLVYAYGTNIRVSVYSGDRHNLWVLHHSCNHMPAIIWFFAFLFLRGLESHLANQRCYILCQNMCTILLNIEFYLYNIFSRKYTNHCLMNCQPCYLLQEIEYYLSLRKHLMCLPFPPVATTHWISVTICFWNIYMIYVEKYTHIYALFVAFYAQHWLKNSWNNEFLV